MLRARPTRLRRLLGPLQCQIPTASSGTQASDRDLGDDDATDDERACCLMSGSRRGSVCPPLWRKLMPHQPGRWRAMDGSSGPSAAVAVFWPTTPAWARRCR